MLRDLIHSRKIIVCAGPGGVGKTTTAAALGALGARAGKRTLVCTIDPAPRLADALGLGTLSAEPRELSAEARAALGIEGHGQLLAARLDTARTFERLVHSQVSDPEMRRRIFHNSIYRQITTTLTGSQEYAATLALYDFHTSGAFDLIVLDTPPTANALDFLEAPHRITEAATSPAIRWFAKPQGTGKSLFSLQRIRAGGALVISRLGKFVGSQFLDDLGVFLTDFQSVLGGFLDRARAIDELLRKPDVGFILIMAPEAASMNEALYFHEKLRDAGIALDAFIANRVMAAPGITLEAELSAELAPRLAEKGIPAERLSEAMPALLASMHHLERVASAQSRELDRLGRAAPKVRVLKVPLLGHDVSSLAALRFIGARLDEAA